ncbi:hypothetical protein [Hymenobacter mucosus]|uniref:Uncharacterized protein n=1 Tax=Hymenobacter mucosus TaxID=1411120 RepID=A0A239A7Y4_9BACT|nr:hypothetical protein [Hymenobacter mucosus]SNR91680.1 hypothetical protein SAMN06269173_11146 [Hymenobacter mucosus]
MCKPRSEFIAPKPEHVQAWDRIRAVTGQPPLLQPTPPTVCTACPTCKHRQP